MRCAPVMARATAYIKEKRILILDSNLTRARIHYILAQNKIGCFFFQGKVLDLVAHTSKSMSKYSQWLCRAPEFQVQPFSAQDLFDLCSSLCCCQISIERLGGLNSHKVFSLF